MLFFTFIKGGGVTPLTGPPNLNGFLSIIRGGGVKSLLTNVNKKMFFFNEGFPNTKYINIKMICDFNQQCRHYQTALLISFIKFIIY